MSVYVPKRSERYRRRVAAVQRNRNLPSILPSFNRSWRAPGGTPVAFEAAYRWGGFGEPRPVCSPR